MDIDQTPNSPGSNDLDFVMSWDDDSEVEQNQTPQNSAPAKETGGVPNQDQEENQEEIQDVNLQEQAAETGNQGESSENPENPKPEDEAEETPADLQRLGDIEKKFVKGSLNYLKEDKGYDGLDGRKVKSMEDVISVVEEKTLEKAMNDADIRRSLMDQLKEEEGLDETTVNRVRGIKHGVDTTQLNYLKGLEASLSQALVADTAEAPDQNIQGLYEIYYAMTNKGITPENAKRLAESDIKNLRQKPEDFTNDIDKKRQELKGIVGKERQSIELDLNNRRSKHDDYLRTRSQEARRLVSSGVLKGKKYPQDVMQKLHRAITKKTETITKPTGEVVKTTLWGKMQYEQSVEDLLFTVAEKLFSGSEDLKEAKIKEKEIAKRKGSILSRTHKSLNSVKRESFTVEKEKEDDWEGADTFSM